VRGAGCVTCGATWGDYWREIDGQRMFFCCSVCADEFSQLVVKVKRETGWTTVDEIRMEGNYRGRKCVAVHGLQSFGFLVSFNDAGVIRTFLKLPD
jgi:hypothetical protein